MKKELNQDELQRLGELLREIELSLGNDTEAEMFDYDDEFIDIEVKHGTTHTEQIKISRGEIQTTNTTTR